MAASKNNHNSNHSNNNNKNNNTSFRVSYSRRDSILYALSIGYGSSSSIDNNNNNNQYDADLPYVWEDHAEFDVPPTLAFSWTFWAKPVNEANKDDDFDDHHHRIGLPPFPPPYMSAMDLVPRECLKDRLDLSNHPVLHVWQSITWHHSSNNNNNNNNPTTTTTCGGILPVPSSTTALASCWLHGRTVAVEPKSVGVFVTAETQVTTCTDDRSVNNPQQSSTNNNNDNIICTLQMKSLILGVDETAVIPKTWPNNNNNNNNNKNTTIRTFRLPHPFPTFFNSSDSSDSTTTTINTTTLWTRCPDRTVRIDTNAALWYRMASGDSNALHVDPQSSPMIHPTTGGKPQPILHGLATLGIVARLLLQQQQQQSQQQAQQSIRLDHLQAQFRKPVFLGDSLTLRTMVTQYNPTSQTKQQDQHQQQQYMVVFQVVRTGTSDILVDRGYCHLTTTVTTTPVSKL